METIVVYAHAISKGMVEAASSGEEVVMVDSTRDLVEAVVYRKNVLSVVIELDGAVEEEKSFLATFVELFPTVVLAVVTDPGGLSSSLPDNAVLVPIVQAEEEIVAALATALRSVDQPNRRHFNRFDWPLQAILGPDTSEKPRYRIRALSAGGAFLERSGTNPQSGSIETITIRFGNFSLTAQCEILDPRQASSKFPDGFGIRFVNLSTNAQSVLERIVNDALVTLLLTGEENNEIPSLDEEELTLSFDEEITLHLS